MTAVSHRIVFICLCMLFPVSGVGAQCVPVAYQTAAEEWQVPADVLYAISLTESGRYTEQYGFNIWPWALNIDGEPYYPDNQQEALALIKAALSAGTEKIAIGPMQVFWSFHRDIFLRNPSYALDLAANIRAGAKILRAFLDRTSDIWTAVGHYYAGTSSSPRSRAHAKWYVDRVQQVFVQHVMERCHA